MPTTILKETSLKLKGRIFMNNNEIITRRVLLNTPQDVKDFCYAMGNFPRNVSIKARHESFVSDAESILGKRRPY